VGNLPRDNEIAAQSAPRPMTNNMVRTMKDSTYLVIRRHGYIAARFPVGGRRVPPRHNLAAVFVYVP
jgi:hypothetical protein